MKKKFLGLAIGISISCGCLSLAALAQPSNKPVINPPPTAKDWANLAKLPDWSGVWNPFVTDQDKQAKTNMPPWTPKVNEQIQFQLAEEKAGRPPPLFVDCLPEGMPAWMLITHNAMEVLFTPGRVTMLGESDGNRLRRIYTDGRQHPDDPDPTFHGHSIGKWEGDTLVVDTVGISPQAYIAISEAAGIPNNGDIQVIERIHLVGKDELHDDIEIIAPKVLTKPWKTTRVYFRQRARKFDIVEGVCLEGYFAPRKDKFGNDIYAPIPVDVGGNRIPPQ
ncbi:hypothetical protein ICN46_08515 [Polynucleobacter sp. Latsch14-2]|jgi:hypothetical protein|uniref:hypothetical protein n=1 Tax=Polynucleobacter sp. Latsch14-2 TaxID=2576920 RepID=UPI001C0B9B64|nr:hypothetical protein [Polynucleobacter sp. Latsch14-2]MBU3614937.1 hypothetical protein [Polynucleobacter sp. Latsch14-2]